MNANMNQFYSFLEHYQPQVLMLSSSLFPLTCVVVVVVVVVVDDDDDDDDVDDDNDGYYFVLVNYPVPSRDS